jgi:hypothetical protein
MAFHTLRVLLFIASGLIVIAGLSFYIIGPDKTLALILEGMRPLLNNPDVIVDMGTPNVDSELRFFAPFFVAYGGLVFLCAKHLRTHLYYVPHLLTIFLLGGLGRVISYFIIGTPHPLFIPLMAIEIGLPILLYFLYTRVVAKLSQG